MIDARAPTTEDASILCDGCHSTKKAPLAGIVTIAHASHDEVRFALCQECGRDAANAIGFLCVREGGWSKLEPRKRRPT